jgi:hypothetical protein
MRISNPVPKISLLIIAAAALYLLLISGQERMADGGLSGDEMYLAEKVFSALPAISVFATLGLGLWRAHRAGSWSWFLVQLFAFPSTYIYTLFINRGAGPSNSFKPNPLRGSA